MLLWQIGSHCAAWTTLPTSPPTHGAAPSSRPAGSFSSRPPFLTSRLGISFAYYGVILASAEMLERDQVCGSQSESEVVVTVGVSEESQSPCHCHMFAPSDYQTMIISTIGEIACKCFSVHWMEGMLLRALEERNGTPS